MKRISSALLAATLIAMAGCRHAEKGPIVQVFADAGGGSANQSTPEGLVQFLSKHDEVRSKLTPLCKQKQSTASAGWSTTDEGKICAANDSANFFGKAKIKSDGVKF